MPRPQWRPVEELSPFARLLREGYMWAQTPNLSVSELAARTGISKQTIWSWLNHNAIPRRATVVQLAERVPELSLDELLEAAGLPSTEEQRQEALEHQERSRASLREFMALVEHDPLFAGDDLEATLTRAQALDFIRGLADSYLRDINTWREFGHESPTDVEMLHAEDTAQVLDSGPITTPEQAHGQHAPRRRHGNESQPTRTTGA